jgi:hypothetical protein
MVRGLAEASLRESLSGVSTKEDVILDALREGKIDDGFGNTTGYDYFTVRDIHRKVRRQVRKGEQWVRDHVDRLCEDGYVEEHPENKPGKKGQRFKFSELSPETLTIRPNEYAKLVSVENWAKELGWQLIPEEGVSKEKNTTTGQTNNRPLGQSEPDYPPNSEFGRSPEPAGGFGDGLSSGDIVFSGSKTGPSEVQSTGYKETPPPAELKEKVLASLRQKSRTYAFATAPTIFQDTGIEIPLIEQTLVSLQTDGAAAQDPEHPGHWRSTESEQPDLVDNRGDT